MAEDKLVKFALCLVHTEHIYVNKNVSEFTGKDICSGLNYIWFKNFKPYFYLPLSYIHIIMI